MSVLIRDLRPGVDPPAGGGFLSAAHREHQQGRAAREDRRRKLAPRPPDRRPGRHAARDRGLRPHPRPRRRRRPGRLNGLPRGFPTSILSTPISNSGAPPESPSPAKPLAVISTGAPDLIRGGVACPERSRRGEIRSAHRRRHRLRHPAGGRRQPDFSTRFASVEMTARGRAGRNDGRGKRRARRLGDEQQPGRDGAVAANFLHNGVRLVRVGSGSGPGQESRPTLCFPSRSPEADGGRPGKKHEDYYPLKSYFVTLSDGVLQRFQGVTAAPRKKAYKKDRSVQVREAGQPVVFPA